MKKSLVVSCYNNNIEWLFDILKTRKDFSKENIFIYDKSDDPIQKYSNLAQIKRIENVGYNINSIFTHIIEEYNNLSEVVIFIKGNLIERGHTTLETFLQSLDAKVFFPIEKYHESIYKFKVNDDGYVEPNNNWYTEHLQNYKYAETYNDFLNLLFKNPIYPDYIKFSPGGNYVVPKENILKYSKEFYSKVKLYVSHHQLSRESHFVERLMYGLWTCNFKEK